MDDLTQDKYHEATFRSTARRIRRRDGFPGQRMFVLPKPVIAKARRDGQQLGVLPTDVGYFPVARGHCVQRPRGVDQMIIIYCSGGVGWADLNGQTLVVPSGRVLLIRDGLPHAYGAADEQPWTIHWAHLVGPTCRAIERLLNNAAAPLVNVGQDAGLGHLFENMFDILCESNVSGSILRASLAAAGLLERLIDARQEMDMKDDLHARMTRVIRFMWRRINAHVTLDELAKVASLSKSHLACSFRCQTGVSPLDYFLRLQMQQAAHLLNNTALSVKAVAARVGYEDPLYFSRRFRRFHDLSPTQYRAENGG